MCVDGNVSLSEEEWADIIDSGGMVGVFVCKHDGVQPFHRMPKHLLPEIRTTVDYDVVPVHLDQYGDPQAFIPGILAHADRICTPNNGDSL